MDEWGSQSAESHPRVTPLPQFLAEVRSGDWNRRAVQLGTIAGKVVAMFRHARGQWHHVDPKQAAGDAAETVRRERAARSEEWRQAVKKRRDELRGQAKAGYERTRARAEQIGRDHPL